MRFNQFIFRNTMRNKNLYLAYFLSVLSTVMSFFTFAVFTFHPKLSSGLHQSVQMGMLASAIIIYVFSFLFVWYSVDIFLQSRKKEFGLLLIQGMSPKQLRKMVFQENMLVGFLATFFGIIVGILFSQLILWISKLFLHIDFSFYFPIKAILVTLISFFILFLCISLIIQLKIPKMDIQTLLKSQSLGKGKVKPSIIKSVLAILLIGIGYGIALSVKGVLVVMAMLPVIFLVILGTSFLFNQLTLVVVNNLQKKESFFWNKTNMLVLSDLSFRMKDNAKAFFLVTVISTVAFSAIGTLAGFKEMSLKQINTTPYDITLVPNDSQTDIQEEMQRIDKNIQKLGISATKNKIATINFETDHKVVEIVSQETYNQLAKKIGEKPIDITDQAVLVINQIRQENDNQFKLTKFTFPDNKQTVNVETVESKRDVIPNYRPIVVVSTSDYKKINQTQPSKTSYLWIDNHKDTERLVKLGEIEETNPNVFVKPYMEQVIIDTFAPIFFIGLFIGLVFFVSAGSFLYFRLYNDMNLDQEKFSMIYKIGFSKKEMKKVVYQQIAILFFTPIIVSVIHGVVALKAMYALFGQPIQLTAFIILGIFIIIQTLYYIIARYFYFKKLYNTIE
ncbi:ABC transporter permease [Vagococcus vulneris]|uniref:Peptide ABC transporter permease n=1 Tax=Vagococcus vulneris TaxID=1977869 RepID=A0A429ZSM8_9ENTE|nr:ABC transporter permease [Vagococcus vulneris]RST96726.1 peptide ABC transporter permease [Vagococcus vulneris]